MLTRARKNNKGHRMIYVDVIIPCRQMATLFWYNHMLVNMQLWMSLMYQNYQNNLCWDSESSNYVGSIMAWVTSLRSIEKGKECQFDDRYYRCAIHRFKGKKICYKDHRIYCNCCNLCVHYRLNERNTEFANPEIQRPVRLSFSFLLTAFPMRTIVKEHK